MLDYFQKQWLSFLNNAIFGPFCPKLDQWKFSRDIELCQFLALIEFQIHAIKPEKNNEPIRRNGVNRQTDWDQIGPLCYAWVQKLNLNMNVNI